MNPRLHFGDIASVICAAVLACAATAVPAQSDVRSGVSVPGHIPSTDQPETPASAQTAENPEPEVTKTPRRIANISPRRVTLLVDANEAALRLRKAQLQREHGVQPLAGEQTRVNGSTTLNYRYWKRQEMLRNLVEQAQRRANQVGKVQLAVR